jgi:myosin heavy subunit
MKKLLQLGTQKPKVLTEEQQIQLATELSLEDATEAAVKMSLEDHCAAVPGEARKTTAVASELDPSPLTHLPKPNGSAEQRQEWRRCLSEGPTILEAREMRYKDLIALLSISHRNVLLSKKQVTELHERETITGRIVILPDGFVLHLLHKVVKLQRKLARYREENCHLRNEVERLLEEARALTSRVRELEDLMKVKDDEIKILKKETKRLDNYVQQLLGMITKDEERTEEDKRRICELERENQRLRDKFEEEANRAKRYQGLLERVSREKNELRRAFECRRDEIVSILTKPLPGEAKEENDWHKD